MPLRPLPGTTDRKVDSLLALLADNPMIVISGAKIGRQIGVSRSTVWRWIETLRSLGVKVNGQPRGGYRIEKVPDVLAPDLLRRQLRGSIFGKRIYHFFKIDSTNDVALRLGQEGEPHGAVVIAEEQTAGRGRARRVWLSEKTSGVYMTVLLRPPIPPQHAPLITMLAGLAVRDAVADITGLAPDLRWPNDVLIGRKKFCGILTEMHAEPDRIHFVVVGMGIDVNHARLPDSLAPIATSLRLETGRVLSRIELVARLLRTLETYYNRFLAEGSAPIIERFAAVSSFANGKRVRIVTAAETYEGTTCGLEPSGLLRVTRDDGSIATVISGDLTEAN
ncbi:MAG: biotin--[acetyl-CoA-carboxylase] ligase [Candidatus Acidiferrales bacterium]|jgi:BirA family biotin operon repressor/biotin-[acetyl-CoA-carboxylase] ligase